MTIKEKIAYSNDLTIFTLFKKGLFFKIYNEDAMLFVKHVRNYKINCKYIKNVGSKVYSIGFPASEIEKGKLSKELLYLKNKI